MQKTSSKKILIIVSLVVLLAGRAGSWAQGVPERILSITPAGTEILYYLGLGCRVVGVTKYCNWPPEARTVPSLGDMMHVNLETVMGLMPDLVLVSNMNLEAGEQIEALGFRTVTVYQDDFDKICDSTLRVGRECGVEEAARLRVEELREAVREKTVSPGASPPSVLVVVGRDTSEDVLRQVYVAGRGSFYEDLLTSAGAVNAFPGDAAYARVSREGLLRLDPDVVIELVGEHGTDVPTERIISQWEEAADIRAVRNGEISVIRGDFTLRAGPRYPQILDAFIKVIHGGAREVSQSE